MQKIIKLPDAAKVLGISRRQLDRWIKAGKVPVILLPSGRRALSTEWLEQLIKGKSDAMP